MCVLLLCRSQLGGGNFDKNGEWIDDASDQAPLEEEEQTDTSSNPLQVLPVIFCCYTCVCVFCLMCHSLPFGLAKKA